MMIGCMQSRRTFLGGALSLSAATGAASSDPLTLTVEAAAGLIRTGKISSLELTQACLRRIQTLNPSLKAFNTVTSEPALAHARVLDSELRAGRRRGPLHGIPIAFKDLFDTAGVLTTAASRQYENRVPREDAEVVARLRAAGAVMLGKLNMDEFAYNFTAETSCFGVARNPWDTRRTPGGSSGGSAVAVASGMCFAALGSDTGGSIRLPAAFCGITGLKPTYGKVSTRGVTPLAWSLDHVGPMCRSAADAALLLGVMAGAEVKAVPAAEIVKLRAGVPRAIFCEGLDAEMSRAFEAALQVVQRMTAGVRDVRLPPWPAEPSVPDLPHAYAVVITSEAFAFHEAMVKSAPGRYHPGTLKSIEMGRNVPASEYIRARRAMEDLRAGSGRLFADADVLITPSAPAAAFEFGKPAGLVFLRNSAPWNMFGLPSISIPCGFTNSGLPLGMQITGPNGRDDLVLGFAAAYQQVTDWHTRRPTVRGV